MPSIKPIALIPFLFIVALVALPPVTSPGSGLRPMDFMDIFELDRVGETDISPDRRMVLFTLLEVNWPKDKTFADVCLVPADGSAPYRRLTHTGEADEKRPEWSPAGSVFAFISDRDGKDQLYLMRADGGEAWRVTDHEDGVGDYRWSEDGKRIAYTAGKEAERQLWLLPVPDGKPTQLTDAKAPVSLFRWRPNSKTIIFARPDSVLATEQMRKDKKFEVDIADSPEFPVNLWSIDVDSRRAARLTESDRYSVVYFDVSPDGRAVAFKARSADRYADFRQTEVYLLDLETHRVERLTENEVEEENPIFSPDSRLLAFSAPVDQGIMGNYRLFVHPVSGGETRILGEGFDGHVGCGFFDDDGRRVYFTTGAGVNVNLFSISLGDGKVQQVTDVRGVIGVGRDKETGLCAIRFTDPQNPDDLYLAELGKVAKRSNWIRLTDLNPFIREIALGQYRTIRWTAADGAEIEGILATPAGGTGPWPLIVQIHGGPASAVQYGFSSSWGYYVNIFTGAGYAVFQPNYRGSDAYGEAFRIQIAGDYFRQAFDDIISGVDYLIETGTAHPDSLGFMGWSAGGHWSNWTLVSTDRFKAISTGAGAVDWISLYAQTDTQATREFYFQGTPYDNWDHYLEVSPLKYINRARTPTLIHFGEKDERIPKPQGDELHMALKKLGVPTEYIVYPGMPHGLTRPHFQLVKMRAEFAWFEKWIRGREGWIDWQGILDTVPEDKK